jgi:hypothetical protein
MIDKSLLAFIDLNGQIDHSYLLFFKKSYFNGGYV